MKILFKLLIACFLFINIQHSFGAHIIGGDVTYICKNLDTVRKQTTFNFIFTMYRDSKGNGAPFDPDAQFGLYNSKDGGKTWVFVSEIITSPKDIAEVEYDNPCIIVPPNIGVQKAVYEFDFKLDWNNGSYLVAYQRCCRNGTISNIQDPGSTGALFSIEIFPKAITSCNNSPTYKKFPPIVICVGETLKFDHSARDNEADQIVYEFCSPLQAGGRAGDGTTPGPASACNGVRPDPANCPPLLQEVSFLLPTYSVSNPIGGTTPMVINSTTGLITGIPTTLGQFVVGVCAKEYRNGELLSTVRRDFQFNVTTCQQFVDAALDIDVSKIEKGYVEVVREGNIFKMKSCGVTSIPFSNKSIQEKNIQGYKWLFNQNNVVDSFTNKDLVYTFNKIGKYNAKMIINPNLTGCSDTANIELEILPLIEADFDYDYDTCIAGPVVFTDKSKATQSTILSWDYKYDAANSSKERNPIFEYKTPGEKKVVLKIEDNNKCRSTIEKNILYQPVPALLVIEPTQFTGCVPASIFFNNLSFPIDTTYKIEWDFGDGKKGGDISPSHLYDTIGIFDVSLKITSPIGCSTSKFFPKWIEVLEAPKASFTYTPDNLTNFNRTAQFFNGSLREDFLLWNFGGKGTSAADQPSFTFPDTGKYEVVLYAFHKNGCIDTANAFIDVAPVVTLQMPNAFSPNNDGLNDDFKGYGYLDGVTNYTMSIWNRWGEEIYKTEDPRDGWNGEKNNKGTESPQGVYVYLVDYLSPRGEQKSLRGHVTLVR